VTGGLCPGAYDGCVVEKAQTSISVRNGELQSEHEPEPDVQHSLEAGALECLTKPAHDRNHGVIKRLHDRNPLQQNALHYALFRRHFTVLTPQRFC